MQSLWWLPVMAVLRTDYRAVAFKAVGMNYVNAKTVSQLFKVWDCGIPLRKAPPHLFLVCFFSFAQYLYAFIVQIMFLDPKEIPQFGWHIFKVHKWDKHYNHSDFAEPNDMNCSSLPSTEPHPSVLEPPPQGGPRPTLRTYDVDHGLW